MADLTQFVNDLSLMVKAEAVPKTETQPQPKTETKTEQKKLKILLVSTHTNQVNGYSKVLLNIIKELSTIPWLSIVVFGTQKMLSADLNRTIPSTVKMIDATTLEKEKQLGFGFAELPVVIQQEKPDVVFLYHDLAIIGTYVEHIRKAMERRSFKIWAYVDMTYLAPPSAMIDVLNRDVERVFCFTSRWKDVLKSAGITRPVDVLPHGVDPAMFRSIPKELARQQLGLPKDIFLFTSLNKNIPRKRLDLLVISFVKLIVRFPTKNIFMLMVTDKGDTTGYALFDIFAQEIKHHGGTVDMFGNRLLITSKDTCYRDEDMNMLYNCGDAHVSCAEGEGFGLCSFESMAVGVPQIVPDINGYNEYCQPAHSLMVKPYLRCYLPAGVNTVTGLAQLVNPEEVSKAMERYVTDEDLKRLHGRLGKEKAAAYTWSNVLKPLVKRLEQAREDDD